MGQVLSGERGVIPYDVNSWRRLSFTYLNAIGENGEIIVDENGVPVDPRTLTPGSLRKGGSRPSSRQSSFSSAKNYDTNEHHSFRGGSFPSERPVLQEYQPKGKTTSGANKEGSRGSNTGLLNQRTPPNEGSSNQNGNNKEQNFKNGSTTNTSGDTTKYANLAFPSTENNSGENRKFISSNSHSAVGPPGGQESRFGSSQNGPNENHWDPSNGNQTGSRRPAPPPPKNVRIEEDNRQQKGGGGHRGIDSNDGQQYHHQQNGHSSSHFHHGQYEGNRAQSPKSSTTWNSTSSEEYGHYSDPKNHHHLKNHEPPSYHHAQQLDQGKSSSHLLPPATSAFGSRQTSARTASSGKSATYLPYNDYYLDRRLRGHHSTSGPPTYSDFSGYSSGARRRHNFRRRPSKGHRIGPTKWIFVLGVLANVGATIWGSGVYLHLASKRMELGDTIQGEF